MIVYGIPNCDSVKKAFTWLKENNVQFEFHNYKTDGISKQKLKEWCKHFGWQNVLNKKSTTYKELSIDEQEAITNEAAAINLMVDKTSSIKRPIVEFDGKYLMRFNEEEYHQQLLD
jgi:Spx/MgsR family transcriptional regulator